MFIEPAINHANLTGAQLLNAVGSRLVIAHDIGARRVEGDSLPAFSNQIDRSSALANKKSVSLKIAAAEGTAEEKPLIWLQATEATLRTWFSGLCQFRRGTALIECRGAVE